jgi:hypothetical protein
VIVNVVKVESVPLKFNYFVKTARLTPTAGIVGKAVAMAWSTRNKLLIAGTALAAAVLTIAAVLTVVAARPAPTATIEAQVLAVLDGMNGSYNRSDFDGFASHICADMLQADGYQAGWYHSRKADGPTEITVNSIDVSGGGAVANVRFLAANHPDAKTIDIDFRREGTAWKACRYHAPRTV